MKRFLLSSCTMLALLASTSAVYADTALPGNYRAIPLVIGDAGDLFNVTYKPELFTVEDIPHGEIFYVSVAKGSFIYDFHSKNNPYSRYPLMLENKKLPASVAYHMTHITYTYGDQRFLSGSCEPTLNSDKEYVALRCTKTSLNS